MKPTPETAAAITPSSGINVLRFIHEIGEPEIVEIFEHFGLREEEECMSLIGNLVLAEISGLITSRHEGLTKAYFRITEQGINEISSS